MHHIGQLKRAGGDGDETTVQLYWLDADRDVQMLSEELLNYLPKLRASPGALLQVWLLCAPVELMMLFALVRHKSKCAPQCVEVGLMHVLYALHKRAGVEDAASAPWRVRLL